MCPRGMGGERVWLIKLEYCGMWGGGGGWGGGGRVVMVSCLSLLTPHKYFPQGLESQYHERL